MTTPDDAKARAASTYNTASDFQDHADRISEVDPLLSLFHPSDVRNPWLCLKRDPQTVNSPEDWWAMIMGSGYRGTVEQLSPADREQVRAENIDFIQRTSAQSVDANVIHATTAKS